MATPINMPQVGQDIESAIVVEWKVKPGDTVQVGDVVALVESDKAVFEVEAFAAGTITDIVVEEGEEGRVFKPVAYLAEQVEGRKEKGKGRPVAEDRRPEERQPAVGRPQSGFARAADTGLPNALRIVSSPSARRLARLHDIDLSTIKGSGPSGRIIKEDILKAVETKSAGVPYPESRIPNRTSVKSEYSATATATASENLASDTTIPFTKIRQTIADRMTRSATTVPHFYLVQDVDVTAALAWRESYNVTAKQKISINDLVIRAVARSLSQYPHMNAYVETDRLIVKPQINIGVAVTVDAGLIVPVIADADKKSLEELSVASKAAADQARSGVMKPGNPGTFTISNLGMYGVSQFFPIINPPEAAILGVGATTKQLRPGPVNSFAVRDMLKLTLACDHRAIDGAYAADFLNSIRTFLEKFE